MTPALLGLIGLILLFIFIFLNVPVGFAMAGIGMIGGCLIRGVDSGLATIGLEYYRTASTYVFSVIPLFIAMGFLAQKSQLSEDAFKVIRNFIGHLRGGLAMATTVSAAIFSAICGDSIATAITIGSVSLPEMRKSNYTDTLSLGNRFDFNDHLSTDFSLSSPDDALKIRHPVFIGSHHFRQVKVRWCC